MNLREQVIKLAHEKPELRRHLLPLIKEAVRYLDPDTLDQIDHPGTDMKVYMDKLLASFLMPSPDISGTLGIKKSDVKSTVRSSPTKGTITFKAPKADTNLKIEVDAKGTHTLTGIARGAMLRQKFKFKNPVSGWHRGTQGNISSYISDNLPAKIVYKVYSMKGRTHVFHNKADLVRKFKQTGIVTSGSVRKELQGQPKIKGYYGPSFDGRDGDVVSVRYETPELYEALSR